MDSPPEAAPSAAAASVSQLRELRPLPVFKPDLFQRGWSSTPHPTLPLLATAHNKSVTVFSLITFSAHSSLTGGHSRSVRSTTWKPGLPAHKLCLVTGSFDSTAGLWRWEQDAPLADPTADDEAKANGTWEVDVTAAAAARRKGEKGGDGDDDANDDGWEFTLVLEGQENEIKSVAFSPSGQYLATCSRDKSVWIWEDVGASEDEDEWETVAVLNEHEGDVKCVAWCPDVPGRRSATATHGHYGLDVLASASYDNTIRIWREDGDGEWVCVAVLEGHTGTVWGVQWEADPKRTAFPRLLSWSADQTLRIWTLKVDGATAGDDAGENGNASGNGAAATPFFGSGIPNTMRRALREEWDCTAVLPKAHDRDIYSATWSASSGLVASTGSDGIIAVYVEERDAAASGGSNSNWKLLHTVVDAHGPFEINNITWCRRFDPDAAPGGAEEMLVTTGDDGIVRPWQVVK